MTTMSVRMLETEARLLRAFATAEDMSVSEVIRVAVADRIESRRSKLDFQVRLRRLRQRKSEDFDLLRK